jgi:hypothetical protein
MVEDQNGDTALRMLGLLNGTHHIDAFLMTTYENADGVPTDKRVDAINGYDGGNYNGWNDYLTPDHDGKYFYDYMDFQLPNESVYAFPVDKPAVVKTDWDYSPYAPVYTNVYFRDQFIIDPPDPVVRPPRYETTVTLVDCDRWIKQDTSTMLRREERSRL